MLSEAGVGGRPRMSCLHPMGMGMKERRGELEWGNRNVRSLPRPHSHFLLYPNTPHCPVQYHPPGPVHGMLLKSINDAPRLG